MLDLQEVGAHVQVCAGTYTVRFGIYLPGITDADYSVIARVIHANDQFTPEIPTTDVPLQWRGGEWDLWSAEVPLVPAGPPSSFGEPGRYLYRYQLKRGADVVCGWFADPFARDAGSGRLSAFVTPCLLPGVVWSDSQYRTPAISDMVVYELQVREFNETFDGVVERLDYLLGLGVNALELMPIFEVKPVFDWGYTPLHYLAPDDRCGGPDGLKRLVDACHRRGIAVVLDVVYEHVDGDFAYNKVYSNAGVPSPMIGSFCEGIFGTQTDFGKPFTREYFRAVNAWWLDEYHVDGFRYDYVAGFFDGPTGAGYADLVYNTYLCSLDASRFPRFQTAAGFSQIVQCAEHLPAPATILRETYSNAAWQNGLLSKVEDMAAWRYADDAFAHLLDTRFSGYPQTRSVPNAGGDTVSMPVAPFQYLESHDHDRLIAFVSKSPGIGGPGDIEFGDRSLFWRLQPFAIALYTCEGVPMLWQGQEIAENYTLPAGGNARISFPRSVHWEYFYDDQGRTLVELYRVLGKIRRTCPALRSRDTFYFNTDSRPGDGILAYRRHSVSADGQPEQYAMVFLNFSDAERTVEVPFPAAGTYTELIRGAAPSVQVGSSGERHAVTVPSNYGAIYVSPVPAG